MKKTIILSIILIAASFIRLWHLGGVPISPNWDEVALGYNAYSILHTGRDEYGVFLPIILKSFGNYTPAVSAYAMIPSILLFGLSAFSIRLPFALFGITAVFGVYLLVKQLMIFEFDEKKSEVIALLSACLMAISPWHIQFSRVAYEADIAFTFWIFGFYFFLLGLKKHPVLILSALFFGLSMNTYHTPRLLVPIFVIGLTFVFRKKLFLLRKKLALPIIVAFVLLIPIAFSYVQNKSSITGRFSQTNIFSQKTFTEAIYEVPAGYVSHFSPLWLFITGDNDRHHAPSTGILYLWEFPFIIAGILFILRTKTLKKVIFLWMLTVPIPASLTSEVPHAVRTLFFLPSWQALSSIGLLAFYSWGVSRPSLIKRMALGTALLAITFFILQYFHLYFYQMNHESSRFWQFGYSDAVSFVLQNPKYEKVVVSNKLEEPYIFFLFYLKYDPTAYLLRGGTKEGDIKAFDKFEFRTIGIENEIHDGKHLYILSPNDGRRDTIHTIRYFDGSEAFIFSE